MLVESWICTHSLTVGGERHPPPQPCALRGTGGLSGHDTRLPPAQRDRTCEPLPWRHWALGWEQSHYSDQQSDSTAVPRDWLLVVWELLKYHFIWEFKEPKGVKCSALAEFQLHISQGKLMSWVLRNLAVWRGACIYCLLPSSVFPLIRRCRAFIFTCRKIYQKFQLETVQKFGVLAVLEQTFKIFPIKSYCQSCEINSCVDWHPDHFES